MSPPSKTACMLVTGEYFDYLDPDPSVITLDVLEHGMSVPRFNNQTTRPIHVTEHCLRVRRIVASLGGGDVDQLRALLHDAPEAIVPWGDCLQPGKTDEMREAEMHVLAAIYESLGLDARALMLSEFANGKADIVHVADMIALYVEALLWQPCAEDWAHDVLGAAWAQAEQLFSVGAVSRMKCGVVAVAAYRDPGECWRTEVEAMIGKLSGQNG